MAPRSVDWLPASARKMFQWGPAGCADHNAGPLPNLQRREEDLDSPVGKELVTKSHYD